MSGESCPQCGEHRKKGENVSPPRPSRDVKESALRGAGSIRSSCVEGIRVRMDVSIVQHKEVPGGETGTVLSRDHRGLPADP